MQAKQCPVLTDNQVFDCLLQKKSFSCMVAGNSKDVREAERLYFSIVVVFMKFIKYYEDKRLHQALDSLIALFQKG